METFVTASKVPGFISRAFKPMPLLLAMCLALVLTTARLTLGDVEGQDVGRAEALWSEAEMVSENARRKANQEVVEGELRADDILRRAHDDVERLRDSGRVTQTEVASILRLVEERARDTIKWHRTQADDILQDAERRVRNLQQRADEIEDRRRSWAERVHQRTSVFILNVLRGLGLLAYLFALGHAWGLPQMGQTGLVAAASVVAAWGIEGAFGASFGVFEFISPYLLASLILPASLRNLRTGDVLRNGLQLVFQRFSIALVLMAATVTGSLVAVAGGTAVLYSGRNFGVGILTKLLGADALAGGIGFFLGLVAFTGVRILWFFFYSLISAVMSAAFLSNLVGPHPRSLGTPTENQQEDLQAPR